MAATATSDRERAFWDQHLSPLGEILDQYHQGPDPNTALMLDLLEPLQGRRVLDFACGAGLTCAWLAARGAEVTGIDVSPASIESARRLLDALGLEADLVVGEIDDDDVLAGEPFDRVTGRWALHHVDTAAAAVALSRRLKPGGRGSFHETMGLNPVLRFARARLMWLPGLARFGSEDEHPLVRRDLDQVRDAFGHLELRLAQLTFARIFDRNVFRQRRPRARRMAGAVDDWLLSRGAGRWSYHQVLFVVKPQRAPAGRP